MSTKVEKSGVSPQALSLPRGGGAIQGLGEKFQPDLHTGVGHFSLPLQLPSGRGGFAPQLTLAYSTATGNGPFGLGWSLGVPVIARQTNQGVPLYDDQQDTFILSGAEDLVEMSHTLQGTRTEVRYRPRTEGLFARILHITDSVNNEDYWEVTARDGVTSRYGAQPESQVYKVENGVKKILAWHLVSSADTKGNIIRYHYRRDDGLNVPEDHHTYCQVYLQHIEYNNYVDPIMQQEAYLVQIDFDYGEYDDQEVKTQEWELRPDPFSTYRPGFEVRTARRCRRILIRSLHAAANPPTHLVRSYDLHYAQDSLTSISLLQGIVQRGYSADQPGSEARDWDFAAADDIPSHPHRGTNLYVSALPPLTFEYSEFAPQRQQITTLTFECDHPPEYSLVNSEYQLVDMYGNGLPDILRLNPLGAWCWRNLGQGQFSGPRRLQWTPLGISLADEDVQFADLQGNGSADLLVTSGPVRGFYENDFSGELSRFHHLTHAPTFSLRDPNVRLVDIDGDGVIDILATQPHHFLYYRTVSKDGRLEFDLPKATERQHALQQWPDVYFAQPEERVRLADMSGDGLQDLALIHDGRVDYWPNLGHNRWGERRTLLNGPHLPGRYDPHRIFLADINGDGLADLVYVGVDSVHYWINQSGNRWSDEQVICCTPPASDTDSVRIADLFGSGSGGLLWSYDWSLSHRNNYRYLDFTGGEKPLLLTRVDNHIGAITEVEYRSSTQDYAADLAAGLPWKTTLPFTVNVVGRVVIQDQITGAQLETYFTYHHGHYDGREREFRGFGRVDQREIETAPAAPGSIPPSLVKTWFHTGTFFEEQHHLNLFRQEYCTGDPQAFHAHTQVEEGDSPAEAYRALTGAVLRREVYSPDGSNQASHPFTVMEYEYQVKLLQIRGDQKHAVFLRIPLESFVYNYERDPSDPRLQQTLILQVDNFGNIEKSLDVAYPRRVSQGGTPLPAEQSQPRLILNEEHWYNQDQPGLPYWVGVNYETKKSEVTLGHLPQSPLLLPAVQALLQNVVPVVFSHVRRYYDGPDYQGLPLGQIGVTGLLARVETLALHSGQVGALYGNRVVSADLVATGYVESPAGSDAWWVQSQSVAYIGAAGYFQPVGFRDALGHLTTLEYDSYHLFPVQISDPLNNLQSAEYDYCAFVQCQLTDPNRNRTAVRPDPFGMVLASAIMGKVSANQGDSLIGWTQAVPSDPLADPLSFLQNTTTRMIIDPYRFHHEGTPNYIHTITREIHTADLPGGQPSPVQHHFAYYDGFGRPVQAKRQTGPGDVEGVYADPRWIAQDFEILSLKGQVVCRVEPFFCAAPSFEPYVATRAAVRYTYDALQRPTRTDYADGTLSRTTNGAWLQITWDENDSVAESNWYAQKTTGTPSEQDAAAKTYQHRDTPAEMELDVLGRVCENTADNGPAGRYVTRTVLDIQGNILQVVDARGLVAQRIDYDLLRHPVKQWQMDSGERLELLNAHGDTVMRWDALDHLVRRTYDPLNRPTDTLVTNLATGAVRLAEQIIYGDSLQHPEQKNLRGKVYQHRSEAGIETNLAYDFKGNLRQQKRQFVQDYQQDVDWNANPTLLAEEYEFEQTYDALNRLRLYSLSSNNATVIRLEYTYQPDNLTKTLEVRSSNAAAAYSVIKDALYTPHGQHHRVVYGNDIVTVFEYDPARFRLTRQVSTRPTIDALALQDYRYTFDAAGNITWFEDAADQPIFFRNQVVSPRRTYTYDPLYRLSLATGREHATHPGISGHYDPPLISNIPYTNTPNALRNYTEIYHYDEVGNLTQIQHQAAGGNWTRTYNYQGNALQETAVGAVNMQYIHDAHGNFSSLGAGHLPTLTWNFKDQLVAADLGGGGRAYYRYDARGRRARKVVIYQNGIVHEHLYLDDFEVDYKYVSTAELHSRAAKTCCETLHVMDGEQLVAQLDTVTIENYAALGNNARQSLRYQLSDLLHSTAVELDDAGQVISFEEYHPYGGTAYHAILQAAKLNPKRLRYNGKEKDAETGFYYYGARYYAPWLGCWISVDLERARYPAWSPYAYALDNPVCLRDPTGRTPSNESGKTVAEAVIMPVLIHSVGTLMGVVGLIAGGLIGGLTGDLSPGRRSLATIGGIVAGGLGFYGITVATGFLLWGFYRRWLFEQIGDFFISMGRAIGRFFTAIGESIWKALSWIGRGVTRLFQALKPDQQRAPVPNTTPAGEQTQPTAPQLPKTDDVRDRPGEQPQNIPLPSTRPTDDPFQQQGEDPLKPKEPEESRTPRAQNYQLENWRLGELALT